MPPDATDPLVLPATVLDLGPQKRGRIRRLKRSSGSLSRHLAAFAARLGDAAAAGDGRDVIPVVLLYECIEDERPPMPLLPAPVPALAAGTAGEPA